MVKLINIVVMIMFFGNVVSAQFSDVSNGGASLVSLANSGVALSDIESIYINQAGITGVNDLSIDLNAEKRFELNAFSSVGLSIVKKTTLGHFGVTLQKFGLEEYSQQKIGFAYARSLLKQLQIGAQFNFNSINIEEFGSTSLFNFEVGFLSQLSNDLSIGVHIVSPISKEINEYSKIQSEITLGLNYRPTDKVNILVDVTKTIDFDPEVRLGLNYKISQLVDARLGYNATIGNVGFGFGVNLSNYALRGGYSLNNVLGSTPAISLQYKK